MTTTTVVVGLILAFLLFTRPGRLIGVVLLGVAFVGLAALYLHVTHPDVLFALVEAPVVLFIGAIAALVLALPAAIAVKAISAIADLMWLGHIWLIERTNRTYPLEGEILPPLKGAERKLI